MVIIKAELSNRLAYLYSHKLKAGEGNN